MVAPKPLASKSLSLLLLNLLCFSLVSSTYLPCKPNQCKPIRPTEPPPMYKYPPVYRACPRDPQKLGVCADLLGGLVNIGSGGGGGSCCALLKGLSGIEAAICLCQAIKANVLGINVDVTVSLSSVLNNCGGRIPAGFKCY
ncbi:hypothetical protein QJS10_CPB11g00384 [Acorus calamus]|uniref:Bifunctional inhibitor/plant lipid transfer protein/seed storage helical domain-containing protein n=1 Tax=Acorus calamus TaxID=4465 RepID=A0AAV9DWU7_ACOCL|nr:hypothetical protein QJS10_CPB11g00384 [Acorus calamus]